MRSPVSRVAQRWLAENQPAILVWVENTAGSVPRETGAAMLVSLDSTAGTVGGGQLEFDAIQKARSLLNSFGPESQTILFRHRYPLGPSLGQCCGGVVELSFKHLEPEDVPALKKSEAPWFRLQLHGAGHVGQAMASLLAQLDVDVEWIDQRDVECPIPPEQLGSIRWLAVDAPEAEVARAEPGTAFLVLTHSHALDLEIIRAVLARGDASFVGLIGSKSKRARFEKRLEAWGLKTDQLVCPIGISGITSKKPQAIAVASIAQLMQVFTKG